MFYNLVETTARVANHYIDAQVDIATINGFWIAITAAAVCGSIALVIGAFVTLAALASR